MITTVIFDMDGLLVDSEGVYYQMYQDLLNPYGAGFTKEEYGQRYCGKKLSENCASIVQDYQLPVNAQQAQRFIEEDEMKFIKTGIPLKKGAYELLNYLQKNNYNIVLATSSLQRRADLILNWNHVNDVFHIKTFGFEVQHGKPAPDIFLLACQKVNCKVEEALVLEDSDMGIMAAHLANIKSICIPDIKKPNEETLKIADCIMSSLDEVIGYLEGNK